MSIKSIAFATLFFQLYCSSSFATSYAPPSFEIEGKFLIKRVSSVPYKSTKVPGCQLDLVKTEDQTKEVFKARASDSLCELKKGQVVELGIGDPRCRIFYHKSEPLTSVIQTTCFTETKWYVHHYIYLNDKKERVVSQYFKNYKSSIAEIDFRDPWGQANRANARALKNLDVNECYSINLSYDQIKDCRQPVEKIISERALKEKNMEACLSLRGKDDLALQDCLVAVIQDLKKPELCDSVLVSHKVILSDFAFKKCVKDIASPSFCAGLPGFKKNICYEAIGYCEKIDDWQMENECMAARYMEARILQRGEKFVLDFCNTGGEVFGERCWTDFVNLKTKEVASLDQLKKLKASVDKSTLAGPPKWRILQLLVVKDKVDINFATKT